MRNFLRVAVVVLATTVLAHASTAFWTLTPSSGSVQVGTPFTLQVAISGLDPTNDLYDYSFDLQFDPAVFEVLAANDGTIFDYSMETGFYIDGTIDNVNGFVTSQSGLDINGSFSGTGGLLGQLTFEAIAPSSGSNITVENVSLQSFNAALNLEPPDIDPGTLPVATLSAATNTDVPEPSTGGLLMFIVAGGFWVKQRPARARD